MFVRVYTGACLYPSNQVRSEWHRAISQSDDNCILRWKRINCAKPADPFAVYHIKIRRNQFSGQIPAPADRGRTLPARV